MQWNELRTFLAVADARSFSRAAERLHLTQPAVSKRVQALEQHLGNRLFDRVGKRVYLTSAGELLKPRAEALLSQLADTERVLRNLSERIEGNLSVATSHHIGLHRLAPVLRTFSRRHPGARLDIRFEDSEEAHQLVRHAQTELAVVTLNPRGNEGLHYEPLWDDPLCFVVSAEHPLAREASIPLAALALHPVILPGPATFTGRIVAEVFDAARVPLVPSMATNYLETISMLVGTGLGWSVLPQSMVTDGLRVLQTDAPTLRRALGIVTNPQRTLSNAALAFQEVLRGYADGSTPV